MRVHGGAESLVAGGDAAALAVERALKARGNPATEGLR